MQTFNVFVSQTKYFLNTIWYQWNSLILSLATMRYISFKATGHISQGQSSFVLNTWWMTCTNGEKNSIPTLKTRNDRYIRPLSRLSRICDQCSYCRTSQCSTALPKSWVISIRNMESTQAHTPSGAYIQAKMLLTSTIQTLSHNIKNVWIK